MGDVKDAREAACFKDCETKVRYSRCIWQGSEEGLVERSQVAKHILLVLFVPGERPLNFLDFVVR